VRDELQQIEAAIRAKELPASFDQLFGKSWDESTGRFNVQETYVLDFKEHIPEDFTTVQELFDSRSPSTIHTGESLCSEFAIAS
jgi:hypothetical protein